MKEYLIIHVTLKLQIVKYATTIEIYAHYVKPTIILLKKIELFALMIKIYLNIILLMKEFLTIFVMIQFLFVIHVIILIHVKHVGKTTILSKKIEPTV